MKVWQVIFVIGRLQVDGQMYGSPCVGIFFNFIRTPKICVHLDILGHVWRVCDIGYEEWSFSDIFSGSAHHC